MLKIFIPFLIKFVSIFISLLSWAIIIHILLLWFSTSRTRLGEIIAQIIEPILAPFRFARIGQIDFSPIVVILLLGFLEKLILGFLWSLL